MITKQPTPTRRCFSCGQQLPKGYFGEACPYCVEQTIKEHPFSNGKITIGKRDIDRYDKLPLK